MKLRGIGGVESIVSMKTDLRCLYLQLGYSQPIIYSIFLCLLFYKQIRYFISYQINKSSIFPFFSLQTIILIHLFLLIFFNYKISPFSKTLFFLLKNLFNLFAKNGMLQFWYPKKSSYNLVGYSDSDFGGCKIDRKSTSDTCHFIGSALVS